MSQTPAEKLLQAVLEPRKAGAIAAITDACAAGADPNAVIPEGSTAPVRLFPGRTLLTHSVHEEASRACKALLTAGADPKLRDKLGWTPWMATTLVDAAKQREIRDALAEAGGTPDGEHIGTLVRAVYDGDVARSEALLQGPDDVQVLASYRVDLLAKQVGDRNLAMIEWLLARGLEPNGSHLAAAVRNRYPAGVERLLAAGGLSEPTSDGETLLMSAARESTLEIVKRFG